MYERRTPGAAAVAGADIVVTGQFAAGDARVSIRGVVYIASERVTLDVGQFDDDLQNLDDVIERLGEDVRALLGVIVAGPRWNVAELLRRESSASDYVARANGYLAAGPDGLMLAAFVAHKAIMLDPNSAEAHYTLGIVRSKQRRTQDALRELKAAASLEPGNVKALLALADVYRQLSDYDGALDALSKAARLDDSADVHLRTAEVLYLGQKNAEARVEVEEVLKRDPGQVRAHILLARVYQAENREDKALEIARTLYRTSGSNTEATTFLRELLVVRARRQEAEGDVQAAVNTYSEAKSVAPTVAIYAALMSLENSRARYQATKQLFEEATAGNYLDVFVYNNAAVAYRRSGENERALSLYDAGIALEPRRSFLYNNKGYALATLSRFDEAVAEYDRAIKVDAKNIIAYVNKVQALVRLERYDKAQQVLDSAKRLEPENRSVALTQGFVYLTQRRWSEALATYDARLVRQPDDAVAQSGRGRALLELGRYGDAIAASDVALSKDGKLASAFSIRGFGKAQTGRIDEGIGDIREALKLEPNNPLAYYDLARIHTKRGETGEALKNLKNAIHIDPLFRSLARASPAFATLQGDDAFRSLVAKPD